MKKLILALLAVATVSVANAQEGSWLLYGNGGFNLSTLSAGGTSVSTTSFNINPGVGYQLSKHSTLGVQGGYGSTTYPGLTSDSTVSGYSAGVFYRYTHNFDKTFFMFAHANASYLGQDFGGGNVSGFGVNIVPAIGVNVYNGWALNFGFGGIDFTSFSQSGLTQTDLSITVGQQFNFGISKNFGCCKKGGHHDSGDAMRHKNMKDSKDDDDE
jgi:hypothetical protein